MASPPLDIELLRVGDPAMTQRFLEALRRCTRRYYVRKPSDVEQVARDALTELLIKLDRGDQPESVQRWVATAASNAAKRHKNRLRPHEPFASVIHSPELAATPSEVHRLREQLVVMEQSLERMPAATRRALIATSLEGRRAESVARELGVTTATVRKDISRARVRLRRELNARETLERLRMVAREARRRRESEQGHPSTPAAGVRSHDSADDSSVTSR